MKFLLGVKSSSPAISAYRPKIQSEQVVVVPNGSPINFTPTLLRGSGTWTQTGKPSAATFNSSTGGLTGTLNTPGNYNVTFTCTNGNSEYYRRNRTP